MLTATQTQTIHRITQTIIEQHKHKNTQNNTKTSNTQNNTKTNNK